MKRFAAHRFHRTGKPNMNTHDVEQHILQLAEAVRAACLAAALANYEDASMRGLCLESAWECAIGAIRALNVRSLVAHDQEGPSYIQKKSSLCDQAQTSGRGTRQV